MKKLLNLIGVISLVTSATISVIACDNPDKTTPEVTNPDKDKKDWTKEDIEKRMGKLDYSEVEMGKGKRDRQLVVNGIENLFFDRYTQKWHNVFSVTTTIVDYGPFVFADNSLLPESNKDNPYSFSLMSAFTFNPSIYDENTPELKERFWQRMSLINDLTNKQQLDIYLKTSELISNSIIVKNHNGSKTAQVYYTILQTNYFVGAIYSGFDALLKEFENKYSKDDHTFSLSTRINTNDSEDLYYNIETKSESNFSWDDKTIDGEKINSKVFSEFVNDYITNIVNDYSDLKLDGEKINIELGELKKGIDPYYYQKGLVIGDYVNYQGDIYRLHDTKK